MVWALSTFAAPLANLAQTLKIDLHKIWDNLSKPPELQDSKLDIHFNLSFTALPHKILSADKFQAEIAELQKCFIDKDRPDFMFKPAYHKWLPADEVAMYMEGIWEQVQMNKDLDLPTQQQLLAQFGCSEIANAALEQFSGQAQSEKHPIEGAQYDQAALHYHKEVYTCKHADLLAQLNSILSPLFLSQLKNLHKEVLGLFKQELKDGLQKEGYNFEDVVSSTCQHIEEQFQSGAEEARKVKEGNESDDE